LGREEPAVPWGEPVALRLDGAAVALEEGEGHGEGDATEAGAPPGDAVGRSLAAWRGRWLEGGGRPVARDRRDTLLLDVETLRSAADVGGWRNVHRMGLATAVLCRLEEGRFEAFGEGRVADLVAALAGARLVVGFNVERFDYRVLAGYTGVDYARLLPTLDLFEDLRRRLGRRLGLGHLAEATLGVGKGGDGRQSLDWVRDGRLDLVEAYCRRDVEVLRDLYLHGRREGWVGYLDRRRGERRQVRVDW
jgi:DEAD/DEAH box helicase domain-containing protein